MFPQRSPGTIPTVLGGYFGYLGRKENQGAQVMEKNFTADSCKMPEHVQRKFGDYHSELLSRNSVS